MAKYMRIRNSITGAVREILISSGDDTPAAEPVEVSATDAPASDATKAVLLDWLADRGVDAEPKATKAELWGLVSSHGDQG